MLVVVLVTATDRPHTAPQRRSRRSRGGDVPRPPIADLIPQLDPRSLAVLDLLSREPVLTTHHVQLLLFSDGTESSQRERCRRTLRRLTRWGLLYRARGQAGRAGGGSHPACYALTTAGERLLALRDGRAPARTRRRPAEASIAHRAHQLAIADVHVVLVVAARARDSAVRWLGEPACWWDFTGAAGRERLKPDGYVEADLPGASRLAWLEVDRGTQSVPTTIAAKVRRYCRAAQAKAAADEPIPLVVFVVARAERRSRIAAQLARWAARERLGETVAGRLLHVVPPEVVVPLLLGGGSTSEAPGGLRDARD